MELKRLNQLVKQGELTGFNRTFMELKQWNVMNLLA